MRLKTKGCGHEASEFITLLGGALQDDRRRSQAAFAAWKDSSQKSTIAPRPGYAGTANRAAPLPESEQFRIAPRT